jgi:predicted site-specific integrase-resolvase
MSCRARNVRQTGIQRDPLLNPAEVAERLGVSRAWLHEAAESGRIPSIRLATSVGRCREPVVNRHAVVRATVTRPGRVKLRHF